MTNTILGLYEVLQQVAERQPDKIALSYFGVDLTYKELLDQIDKTALAFKKHGVKSGDIICLSLPSLPEALMTFYALNRIGAIPCLFDVRYTPAKICEIVDRTQAKMLFIMGFMSKTLACSDQQPNVDKVVVVNGICLIPKVEKWCALGEWFNGRKRVFKGNNKGKYIHWKDFITVTQDKDETLPYHWAPDEMTALFQTSGTTGNVKSVMLSTENIMHSVFPDPPIFNEASNDDTVLCFLPIFAFYGTNVLTISLSFGMRIEMIPLLKPKNFLNALYKHKPQHVFTSPACWDSINSEKKSKESLSYLKTIVIAGDLINASFEKNINAFLHERNCQFDITKGYGMTEAGGSISITPQGCEKQYELGFSGIPNSCYEVKTFEDEICIRSNMKFLGYYKNEEATKELIQTHPDGSQWLHTGDIGYVDENGYIYIIGRKKRMIVKFDGSKIFPAEIEDCLMHHPMVTACAVVPMQDPNHSESKLPKAFVVLDKSAAPSQAVNNELMKYCKDTLPEYLVPTVIAFIDTIPVNSNGKVDYLKLLAN